ncbi:hypothetical protein [Nostoc sp.]
MLLGIPTGSGKTETAIAPFSSLKLSTSTSGQG